MVIGVALLLFSLVLLLSEDADQTDVNRRRAIP
jgi:hypothetical protein